jgi:uroporphyrinogen-III decarboxylase
LDNGIGSDPVDLEVLNDQGGPGKEPIPWSILSEMTCTRDIKLKRKITDLVDDLAQIGVKMINPVQVSALGDTASLKARFGKEVTFWGGIDTQHVLPRGSVADVEAEVRKRIRDLGPSGGYVAGAVHNIQPDVPPENILALADAVRKYGTYPLPV